MPRGGARPNSGPKKDTGGEAYGDAQARKDFEIERARHEAIKADQREFKLQQERGEYVSRAAQQQASSTLLALVAQSLRSIPDNLERTLALPPATVEAIAVAIDSALAELAAGLRTMASAP